MDVRDADAFSALIDRVYASHGRIDYVIHGAGVIEDRKLEEKTANPSGVFSRPKRLAVSF